MEVQPDRQQLHAMGNVLQVIIVLLVQQVQHKMYVVQESIVQLEVQVQQTVLQDIMEVQQQILFQHAMEHVQQVITALLVQLQLHKMHALINL